MIQDASDVIRDVRSGLDQMLDQAFCRRFAYSPQGQKKRRGMGLPSINASMLIDAERLTIIAMHHSPPIMQTFREEGPRQLKILPWK